MGQSFHNLEIQTNRDTAYDRGWNDVFGFRGFVSTQPSEYFVWHVSPALAFASSKYPYRANISFHLAAISGLAFWTIWKGKRWARGWATAASLLFILMFLRQFVVPARPAWDHHVSALLLGMLGLASFWCRDKQPLAGGA
jgi:uncharacterized membrane protein